MTTLTTGKKAPAFKGLDQNGNKISITDFKGKKIILYFYPKDDTPGCTAQACNLRDNYSALLKKGFAVVGVSTDAVKTHKKFETKY
jgi:peroxiredoxin Q/BCP